MTMFFLLQPSLNRILLIYDGLEVFSHRGAWSMTASASISTILLPFYNGPNTGCQTVGEFEIANWNKEKRNTIFNTWNTCLPDTIFHCATT